jgi:hypothetical protein
MVPLPGTTRKASYVRHGFAPAGQLHAGNWSSFSPEYMTIPNPTCLRLLAQLTRFVRSFRAASAGKSNDARIAMIAITTSSSITVKPREVSTNAILGRICDASRVGRGVLTAPPAAQ